MHRKIAGIIKDALNKGQSEYNKRFLISKHDNTARELHVSIDKTERVRDGLLKYIKNNIDKIDWQNEVAVNNFCLDLDKEVENHSRRFITAHTFVDKSTSLGKWKEFKEWINELRNKTKTEIIMEIRQMQVAEKEKAVTVSPVEETASSTTGTQEEPYNLTAAEEIQDEVTDKMDSNDVKDDLKIERPKINPEEQFNNIGKLAAEAGVPIHVAEALTLYTEALRGADMEGAAEYLPEVLATVGRLEKDRREAEAVWEADSEGPYKRISSLETEVGGLQEKVIAVGDLEKQATKENVQLREQIQSEKILLEELRSQLREFREKIVIFEAAKAQASEEKNIVEKIPEKSSLENLTEKLQLKRELLIKREEELQDKINEIYDETHEIISWSQEMSTEVGEEISRKKSLTTNENENRDLKNLEKSIRQIIIEKERERAKLDSLAATLDEQRRKIVDEITALRQAEQAAGQVEIMPDFESLPEIGVVELPKIETLMGTIESSGVVLNGEKRPDETQEELQKVDGLPYTVEFSRQEMEQVREVEKFLTIFKGQSVEWVVQHLPPRPADEIKARYYDGLIDDLNSGEFLHSLKLAFATVGAMRDENLFKPRISRDIGQALHRKDVRIVHGLKEASKVMRAFLQMDMLSSDNEMIKLSTRGRSYKWGPLNVLTPLGELASQVWTKDLLDSNQITKEQLQKIYVNEQTKRKKD